VDSTNAFNCVSRAAIAEGLAEHFPQLLPFFILCHRVHGKLRLRMADGSFRWLESHEGAQQGDVLGPFFFSLALHPILRQVQSHHPATVVTAYLDDSGLAGPPTESCSAVGELVSLLPTIGLTPNLKKSFVYSPSPLPAGLFPADMKVALDGVRALGVPVGSQQFQRDWVAERLAAAAAVAERIARLKNKQVALMLLRYVAVCRPVMLLRTVPPSCTAAAAAAFDDAIRSSLASLLGPARGLVAGHSASAAWTGLLAGGGGVRACVRRLLGLFPQDPARLLPPARSLL
jgi:hypothetical protein